MARPEARSAEMKELIALLDAFDEQDERDRNGFQQLLREILAEALPELSDRLVRPSTSRGLRRLILASPGPYPHRDWTAVLLRALLHEVDEELFEEGCRALVQIGGMAETDALRQIARQRQEPALQATVLRKLAFLEPRQPFSYHFRDLLVGSQNPRLSQQAAQHLIATVQPGHLQDLQAACSHPDSMASLLALKVVSAIHDSSAAHFLAERFREASEALLLDGQLRNFQEQIRRAPAQGVKAVVLELLRACPGMEPHAGLLLEIEQALQDPASEALALVQRLRNGLQGVRETRLVDCLADLALERSVRLANLMPESPEEHRHRTQRLQSHLDACAEGLTQFVEEGVLAKEDVLPLFQKAYEGGAGGEGFGRSFAQLLDVENLAQMELVLQASNHRWREEGIKVLGERQRAEFTSFFLKAMADPIVDNAQLAIRYFGLLPGAFEIALDLFQSGKADHVERALEIFSINGMVQAGPVLVAYLEQAEREDLTIGVVRCLGGLQHHPAREALARLLRFGQSPRLTRALAESLIALGSQEAALSLLLKATELRNPDIQLLAVEGIARMRPTFSCALTSDEAARVEQLLEACFNEGMGLRVRAIESCRQLWSLDAGWYERLERRISGFLVEQSKRQTWDREQQQMVASVVRELQRRRKELGELLGRGSRVRELAVAYAPGDRRTLDALVKALEDPGLVLGLEARVELTALLESELLRPGIDELSLEALCRLAGHLTAGECLEPLQDLFQRCAPASTLHGLCADSLRRMGCPEAKLAARNPLRDILLLEPSAFFRKRLLGALPGRSVREAQDRTEAEALLRASPGDLLISESSDAAGDLRYWFASLWRERLVRQVILSTTARSAPSFAEAPWLAGALFKPYAMEELSALLSEQDLAGRFTADR